MLERQAIEFLPDLAKAMHVTVADGAPVNELDAKLECALRGA